MSTATTTRRVKTIVIANVGRRSVVIRRTASDRWQVRILGSDGKAVGATRTPFALATAKRKARKVADALLNKARPTAAIAHVEA